ncbi:hypothetical protein LTR36_010447 [Oleoguttula mirabilis]|uniref:Small ribosomal subunit protein bS18m n=1 Tax=Oleoguttula mirabilis TaxID=1507867 RepID=A0AAV9J462_9PEZI|nr:hypothetical protein LTR36_010447 [Oleoguttula mirabilis]
MSLEHSFRRLAIQSKSVCHQCRRTLATSAHQQQQQSATGAFHELLQASRNQPTTQRTPTAHPSRPSDPFSATTPPPSPPTTRNPDTGYRIAADSVIESTAARRAAQTSASIAETLRGYSRKDLELQITRRWRVGDVYSPHDLSGVEMSKWKKQRRKPRPRHGDRDVMDQLGMNPMDHYRNFSIMGEYVTEMGRIRGSVDTALRPVNQRRMAKAVRRAIGIGLMPSVYRHPELLREEMEARNRRYGN